MVFMGDVLIHLPIFFNADMLMLNILISNKTGSTKV